MTLLADLLSTVFERRQLPWAEPRADDRPLPDLAADLVRESAETQAAAVAGRILAGYGELDDGGRLAFFRHLAGAMNIDPGAVRATLGRYEDGPSRATYAAFMAASEPPRQELIRRLNRVPGATPALVAMRADLLRLGRGEPALEALDLDFRHLFASWFNRGFLVLRPISWQSPAHVLERIIAYEAVHSIDSWDELRRRLAPPDRRCFAFFHPAMPDDPLIFVEVALTRGVPGSIQALLSEEREALAADRADTAAFYSISNCQPGLAGVSFGDSLIKQVVADLSAALPGLSTFVTLSPIPGLARWMADEGHAGADDRALRALAARYLLHAKRPDGRPLDPVARFHLGNGAVVHAVHARADTSEKGLRQSAGAMVNYLYDPRRLARNHERYAAAGEVAASQEVRSLAAAAARTAA